MIVPCREAPPLYGELHFCIAKFTFCIGFLKGGSMQKKRIVLSYPSHLVDQPVISKLVKDYDLMVNIMRARITPNEEGRLVLELTGKRAGMEAGFKYLSEIGVEIQPLAQDVKWHEDRCTHRTDCISG